MKRDWRERSLDLALGAIALVFALPSLTYPLSRDQGIFYYVGREWLLRGALPYRDVIDNKTPLVYGAHALCIAVFGETMWGIRAVEIALVAAVGLLAARLSTSSPRARVPAGAYGASMLVASVFYYGYLPYQDSANCEIWCAAFGVAAVVAAREMRRDVAASLAAGALLGLVFLAKPPALAFAPLVAYAWTTRDGGRRAAGAVKAAALALVAFSSVVGAVVAYFAEKGALGAMIDLTVRANMVFNATDARFRSLREWAHGVAKACDWFEPWSYAFVGLCAIALGRALWRRDRALAARYARPIAWAACAYVAITAQRKLFVYHHALFIVPCALLGALLWTDLARVVALFARQRASLAIAAAATAFALATIVSCVANTPSDVWCKRAKNAVLYAAGALDRHALVETFDSRDWIDLTSVQRAADFVRERSAPDDALVVRGYEPELYYFAHRRYGGRFFWSWMLVSPKFSYRRDEWLAQDRDELARIAPAWAVTSCDGVGVESVTSLQALGYEKRAQFGDFVVMERHAGR